MRVRTMTDLMVGYVVGNQPDCVYPGANLFRMKATHGLPLDVAIDYLMNERLLSIDWVGFMEEARRNGWYDFQSIAAISDAFVDVSADWEVLDEIITRIKMWVVENPLSATFGESKCPNTNQATPSTVS